MAINNLDTNNLGNIGSTTTDKNQTTNPKVTINVIIEFTNWKGTNWGI